MNFENYAARITNSNYIDNFEAPANEYKEQQRFTIVGDKMQKDNCHENKIFSNE